jgi:DNA-binding NtrC family response regulator/class 3 adenylate cyclase/predicted ATPase
MVSRQVQPADHPTARLLGTSPAMAALRAQIRHLVRFDTVGSAAVPTLLLQGETGTGKGLVARVIHDSGPRATGPFVEVNCAAFPETMLEAELFGFEAGAFTDARRAKPGLFEAAAGGTLFLDEIDAVPLTLQGKLLTALESKRVRRLGAVTDRVVDVKIIAATNADLGRWVSTGRLRADLYHRLAVVVLTLPPLRQRGEDVLVLARALLAQLAGAHGLPPKHVQADAAQWLQHYAWPGNVRELGHVLERVTLLHREEVVDAATLARWCQALPDATHPPTAPTSDVVSAPQEPAASLLPAVPTEAGQLQEALRRAGGNLAQAARLLGLSRDQLRTRMRRYQLTRPPLTPLPASQANTPLGRPLRSPEVPSSVPEVAAPRAHSGSERPGAQVPAAPRTPPGAATPTPEAERRHLTILFADLVDSTALASSMDPEDWQEVLQAYHTTCRDVMAQCAGHVAQYLGDGVLVYFGYPQAHEDDALRAVRAGLALVTALQARPPQGGTRPVQVRVGIHSGLVVIDAVGTGAQQAPLALGETPHLAARLQSVAMPGTVVCSEATARLVAGYVTVEALGSQMLKGVATPLPAYRVVGTSGARSRLQAAMGQRLTPLVGREAEVALLRERWTQVQHGQGQVVILSGEAGIGKSRLVQVVQEQLVGAAATQIVCQGTSAQQYSPLAPIIAHLHRACGWHPDDAPEVRVHKLELALQPSALPLPEVVPLFAALLTLPLPPRYTPRPLSPQQQKQQQQHALLHWLLHETTLQPVLLVVEDLHWIDPSTLEWLSLLIDQVPDAPLYLLGTCRPEFSISWLARTYCTQLTLTRLSPPQAASMVTAVAEGKRLPPAVLHDVAQKSDGVPLFIEELTKMVLETDVLQEDAEHYTLRHRGAALAIPTTLQASLMARLDRLGSAKAVAQLGATIGRQFPYAVLQAVAPQDATALQQDLACLVEAELLYQRGVPPQATYRFKHALIQDAAYQSLLRRTRQQYHRQIAQVLTERFPETVATQPELLAQHYTEAGLAAPAVEYWQRAGQQAAEHAAYAEAITHFTQGLEVLQRLPETPTRLQQELTLHLALGAPLMAVKGLSALEVHATYARAQELCQQVADLPQRFLALHGVWAFAVATGALQKAQELADQLLSLTHQQPDPTLLLGAHRALAATYGYRGEITRVQTHAQQGLGFYDSRQHRILAERYGQDPGIVCRGWGATALWLLGYPDQALQWSHELLALCQGVVHPPSHSVALHMVTTVHQLRRDAEGARRHAEALITLSTTHRLPQFVAMSTVYWGRALVEQGQQDEGLRQICQGIDIFRELGLAMWRPYCLTLLAEAYAETHQAEAGLYVLTETLAMVKETGECWYEAESHRLTGELGLACSAARYAEAETCFQQALAVARRQQAKSLELRAALSLARLWQQQGKQAEASALLAPVYGWFTEGFDTADLQEAKALLMALT